MLATIAPFPNPGSTAYLARDGAALKVRVLQHKPGGEVLVSVPEQRCCHPDPISGRQPATTCTVPRADLYPDGEAAMLAGKPARRARTRRPSPRT